MLGFRNEKILIEVETEKLQYGGASSTRVRTETLYKQSVALGQEKEHESSRYTFTITVPSEVQHLSSKSPLKRLLNIPSETSSISIEWQLTAYLEIPWNTGISSSIPIHIME